MIIGVAQYYTKNIEYAEYSQKINAEYCNKHGYSYFLEKNDELIKEVCADRAYQWYKVFFIRDILENSPECDYLLFLDIDAIFVNWSRKIEEFITPDFSILMTEDYGPSLTNTGVILVKNDVFTKNFLKKWWEAAEDMPDYKRGLWHEQSVLKPLYDELDTKENIKILQPYDLNSRQFDTSKFIFHAFSYGSLPKRTIDIAYYTLFNIKLPSFNTLLEAAPHYATDKHYDHNYFQLIYDKVLSPLKYEVETFIEIGVFQGDSILLWRDFFENATVVGIEKFLEESLRYIGNRDLSRIDLVQMDASIEENLVSLCEKYPSADIIIDDGSHKMFDQQITLAKLFKIIKPGGIYILEDLHTSLEVKNPDKAHFEWGSPDKVSTLDMLNEYIKTGKLISDYMSEEDITYLENNILSVEIYQSRPDWSITSIIRKKNNLEGGKDDYKKINKHKDAEVVPNYNRAYNPNPLSNFIKDGKINLNFTNKKNTNYLESNTSSTTIKEDKREDGVSSVVRNNKNLIVYHIYCVDNYIEVVKQQLNRVIESTLYDWCDSFEVTCIDQKGQYDGIDELFVGLDKVNIYKTEENRYEYWAIKKIWDISQTYTGKVLYFHTKGVSNKYKNIKTKEVSDWKVKGVNHWKECMEYFLIDRYITCVEKLDQYDTCGVSCNNGWYSGNFWWANLSYIKENNEPGHGDRWYYEDWLHRNRLYKSFEFYHFDYNPFFSYFPEDIYKTGKNLNEVDCDIDSVLYGGIDVQQDEGYQIPEDELLVDVTDKVLKLIDSGQTQIKADNVLFGDPAYMTKKYLILNLYINGVESKIVYNEGASFDISFIKIKNKKPKILFLGHTSKVYDGHQIKIDRSDLTRRMSCLETWVPEVEFRGHEVIFFEGDSEEIIYDENNKLLSIPVPGDYDYNPCRVDPPRSLMLNRLIKAMEWALKNKTFDYIFRTDDGSYINSFLLDKVCKEIEGFDFVSNNFLGGAGMFFSRDLCEKIVRNDEKYNYSLASHIEDIGIAIMIQSMDVKIQNTNLLGYQYVLGEEYFTIHYTNGKRMYFSDYIIKRYYNEGKKGARKIIINYPIDSYNNSEYSNTWSYDGGKTPRWYSYTTNQNNWEHYGQLVRSNFNPNHKTLFGKNSTQILIIYKVLFDVDSKEQKEALLSYYDMLVDNGLLYFFYEQKTNETDRLVQFYKEQGIESQEGSSNIKYFVDTTEIVPEEVHLVKIRKRV